MKSIQPTARHLAFRKALENSIRDHGQELDALDLLAISAHFVGQLIALQDQRTMTPAMVIELVQSNIEQGNREVVEGLLHAQGGHA